MCVCEREREREREKLQSGLDIFVLAMNYLKSVDSFSVLIHIAHQMHLDTSTLILSFD